MALQCRFAVGLWVAILPMTVGMLEGEVRTATTFPYGTRACDWAEAQLCQSAGGEDEDTSGSVPRDAPVTSEVPIDEGEPAEQVGETGPAATALDSGFFVVWWDQRAAAGVYGARIAPDGTVLDRSGIAVSPPGWYVYDDARPGVATDGTISLVAWSGYYGDSARVCAARVAPDGMVLDPAGIALANSSDETDVAVASDGSGFIVVWEGVGGVRISADGQLLDSQPIVISRRPGERPAVSFGKDSYLVVWDARVSDSVCDVYGARVTPDGSVLDSSPIVVSVAVHEFGYPAVAFDGTNFLVAWQGGSSEDPGIYGTRVSAEGKVLDPVALALAGPTLTSPALVYDGADFLVGGLTDSTSWLVRVKSSGEVAGRYVVGRSEIPGFDQSALASDWEQVLLVRPNRSGSRYHIFGARVTREGKVLDPGGLRISRPDPARSRWR